MDGVHGPDARGLLGSLELGVSHRLALDQRSPSNRDGARSEIGARSAAELRAVQGQAMRVPSTRAGALAKGLHDAFLLDKADELEALLNQGASLKELGMEQGALQVAVELDALDCVRELARLGRDVNQLGANGSFATHLCCDGSRDEMLALLIELGAQVDALNAKGESPLALAAAQGYPSTVRTLLDAGASPSAGVTGKVDALGAAALRCLRESHGLEIARLLLDAGADAQRCVGGQPSVLLWAQRESAKAQVSESAQSLLALCEAKALDRDTPSVASARGSQRCL